MSRRRQIQVSERTPQILSLSRDGRREFQTTEIRGPHFEYLCSRTLADRVASGDQQQQHTQQLLRCTVSAPPAPPPLLSQNLHGHPFLGEVCAHYPRQTQLQSCASRPWLRVRFPHERLGILLPTLYPRQRKLPSLSRAPKQQVPRTCSLE